MAERDGESVRVRRAEEGDAAALAELAARTFRETFGADNRPEDMEAHLASEYGAGRQAAEILDPNVVTLVAETPSGRWAGYAQVRRGAAPSCVTGPEPVELWRFYVDRPFHGQGVARVLMDEVYRRAAELGGRTLWLGVWERNPRAIAFYTRSGYTDVGSHTFRLGSDLQTDRIMVRPLGAPA